LTERIALRDDRDHAGARARGGQRRPRPGGGALPWGRVLLDGDFTKVSDPGCSGPGNRHPGRDARDFGNESFGLAVRKSCENQRSPRTGEV
jgi:hypothetical protein